MSVGVPGVVLGQNVGSGARKRVQSRVEGVRDQPSDSCSKRWVTDRSNSLGIPAAPSAISVPSDVVSVPLVEELRQCEWGLYSVVGAQEEMKSRRPMLCEHRVTSLPRPLPADIQALRGLCNFQAQARPAQILSLTCNYCRVDIYSFTNL